tara:strand:+ start:3941 stop:4612 length:672 start_codon:yes stop_codon:yes gene_type:complete
MKIQTILFMCNDFARAKFTLENFNKWNPESPILVVNSGGESPERHLKHIPNTSFIDAPNLWHKKTSCGQGSFGPLFADYLFDYGLNSEYDYTLLLETDVLTNRKISTEPRYDISGPTNFCGETELPLYEHLSLEPDVHTGCGATMFTHNYFKHIKDNNYIFFKNLFESHSKHYFMDLVLTLAARVCDLSYGYWEETANVPIHQWQGKICPADYNKTLIHNYKI